jgi:hypothetical protein
MELVFFFLFSYIVSSIKLHAIDSVTDSISHPFLSYSRTFPTGNLALLVCNTCLLGGNRRFEIYILG